MKTIFNRTSAPIIAASFFSALLTGCGAPLPLAYHGTTSVVAIPEINTEATAEIGQTMISKANVTKLAAIKISSDVSELVNFPGTTTVHAGNLPLFASNQEGRFYRDYTATYTAFGATVEAGNGGIFVPNDKTKPPVIYHFAMKYLYGNKPVTDITESTAERWGKDSFKKELVYSGVSQNTISVLYREYFDNVARPAFSQELKYDLAQGNAIGYKGARFEVIKASNTELTYKVIKPLD